LDLQQLLNQLHTLPIDEQRDILVELEKLEAARDRETARGTFMPFVRRMWPAFIAGEHHAVMAEAFERVLRGECKRLIINMPPRHTKSEFASYLLPAWFLGNKPGGKVIQCSNTGELAVGFGRKVRNLVGSEDYQGVFPGIGLQADSKAAGRWQTNHHGEYFAIGVGGTVTGKGADLLIVDDPHSEQEAALAAGNPGVFDSVYEWYTSGPRQRMQPGGAIIVVMTRWSKRDLAGRVLQSSIDRDGVDGWEVIELPAILPSGNPLWPEFWPLKELLALKAELPVSKWLAQYMQTPTAEEGAIVKREWWRTWAESRPPRLHWIVQSWDTAFLKTQRSDYSACTTWGVFYREDDDGKEQPNILLLDAFQERLEFPDLKKKAQELYNEWSPDSLIVEAKASGAPLMFELRRMGIPVQDFTPSRGNDKISRVNAVSDLFRSGIVWAPQKRWAEEVKEQFAGFPGATMHDDLVDKLHAGAAALSTGRLCNPATR
jgi:predicted phage terminase large subunit-like protein